ncbi:hypothetical protein EHR_02285 [Enterococcus hirae ATCC 9790]|uniref:Uncharacterized protein n=1 Tax=Enterococcus hirae (strain ATCC 9790 / DSM 20160 / JCM 8729 / LMG 6399 / NBRC 3181 / NCIMB 6459 / NCDO 1258 / NCTC 12367 / WDCM 00089 / R) TaxID=768486 RepID=I6T8B3_ENTHA|nr:hypothetical protein EHR_02285 [Enterococcus hirae ATCC 9790]
MDFKKIEWIFFVAFLGLNVFYLEVIKKRSVKKIM